MLKLHRTAFGPLTLPEELAAGEYRALTAEEIEALRRSTANKADADTEEG